MKNKVHHRTALTSRYLQLRPTITFRETIVDWSYISISWSGHEFLDAARDENVWNKTTKTIGEQVKSVSFDMLSA